jgi:DNA (cytosine-5)-methyltransferase 1
VTYGSLFTGIGGLDLGLDRAGLTCRWQVENEPYAGKVLEKHWPGVKRYGDITAVNGRELEPVDLICGGFPCQDLSQAGKRIGIEGTRSGLWFEYARIVGLVRPLYVLIENVPGLLVPGAMRRVVGELARLGYVGCYRSLRASEFGASHLRKRVFIVAYRADDGRSQRGEAYHVNGCDASGYDVNGRDPHVAHGTAGGLGILREPSGCNGLPDGSNQELAFTEDVDRRRGIDGAEAGTGPISPGLPFAPGPSDPRWPAILRERPDLAPALESQVRGVVDGVPGWLDGAMSNRTKRLGRLGNAVVPQIAEWIGHRIIEFDLWQTK